MEAAPAVDSVSAAVAANSNLNVNNRRPGSMNLPSISVYTNLILRQLMIISVFTILFNIVQFVCQICLLTRSKRLVLSFLNAFGVCWTFLLVLLTLRWLMILHRNKIEVVKKGKLLAVGCQFLSVMNLISSFIALCLESADDSPSAWRASLLKGVPPVPKTDDDIKWLMGSMIGCNILNIALFSIIIYFIRKGEAFIHRVIGSWLWLAIYQHMQVLSYDTDFQLTVNWSAAVPSSFSKLESSSSPVKY